MTDSAASIKPPSAWRLWENPIFRRYCRSRLRAKGLAPALILTIVFSAFAWLITPMTAARSDEWRLRNMERMRQMAEKDDESKERYQRAYETQRRMGLEQPQVRPEYMYQRMALMPLLAIQAFILFVIGTGQVAGGMTSERDDGMVDYQRLTPMTPLAKVLGYLFGLPVREWVMFLATLPFMGLALWRGQVPAAAWTPVALIFFTSVTLYHLTGLVAGSVFKSRRWAFLLSMGLVFLLYFLVPQGSRFGLPFLRYVTMWPTIMESAHIFPAEQVRAWRMASAHVGGAGVDFFRWNFSDLFFTLIVQGSFILTMIVMVWRKWRQADSHLLSKGWALLVFAWLSILPIGNALPGILDGSLFPGSSLRALVNNRPNEPRLDHPSLEEAAIMCVFFGLLTLIFLILMVVMLTPSPDMQARGLRRAARLGRKSAPFFADESSAFPVVLALVACGTASWTWFTRSVLGSHWFHSADPGWLVFPVFLAVLAPAVLGLHSLIEAKGGKWPFLAVVFIGIVPILASLIVLASSRQVPTAAVIIAGASPLAQTACAVEQLMPWRGMSGTPGTLHAAAGNALVLWPALYTLATLFLIAGLRRHWRQRRTGK